MTVIHGEAVARRNVKTATDSVHFHITIYLAALREGMFDFLYGFVVLTLFNISRVWRGPLFESIGLSYFLASVATSANKIEFYRYLLLVDLIFDIAKNTCGIPLTSETLWLRRSSLHKPRW